MNRWKIALAIFKGCNGSLKSAAGAMVSGIAGAKWHDMDIDGHMLVILGMVVAVSTYLDGYVDQNLSRISIGGSPGDPQAGQPLSQGAPGQALIVASVASKVGTVALLIAAFWYGTHYFNSRHGSDHPRGAQTQTQVELERNNNEKDTQ